MEYPMGHTLEFKDRGKPRLDEPEEVTRKGTVNGDSLEAKEGVFYPVWVDELSNTIYVHFDNIIES